METIQKLEKEIILLISKYGGDVHCASILSSTLEDIRKIKNANTV